MKAMILAAGLGTRLKPLTDRIPKALVPIAGKPLLEWQLEKLRAAGIREVVINVHHFADQVEAYVRENASFGMDIRFSDERELLLETGGGLRKAAALLGNDQPVLVCNVDVLSTICLDKLIAAHDPKTLSTIVVSPRETQRYFLFDTDRRLMGWTNRKTGEVKPAELNTEGLEPLAFSGMHVVSPEIFEVMQPYPDKFSITDFYIDQCREHVIKAFVPSDYRMMDIGKIDSLDEAERFAKTL
ncbi:MAG: nucleotidyltransferase family protein [Paludibacteraceae bacterium]|nr:nucleotidyltransferase family protein [Paludibacteraceae bacterium]